RVEAPAHDAARRRDGAAVIAAGGDRVGPQARDGGGARRAAELARSVGAPAADRAVAQQRAGVREPDRQRDGSVDAVHAHGGAVVTGGRAQEVAALELTPAVDAAASRDGAR